MIGIKNQKLFFISLIGIVVVSLMLVTTYAYQSIRVEYSEGSDSELTVEAGVLDVSFTVSNRINLENMTILPNFKAADYIEFTLDNTNSTDDAVYYITLENLVYDSAFITKAFKYTVVVVNDDGTVTEINTGSFKNLNGTIFELKLEDDIYAYLEKGNTENVRVYLWLDQNETISTNIQGKSFKGIVNVTSLFAGDVELKNSYIKDRGTLAYNILKNSINSTEFGTEAEGFAVYRPTPTTNPAEFINNIDEASLSQTEDDYTESSGINSYYFRGNVKNNYVNFAGMCWRIVRIEGDGSVKLILEDQYTTCDDNINNTYTGAWNIPTSNGESLLINLGNNKPYRTGNIGYKYENIDDDSYIETIISYLDPITVPERSMVNAFKYFQKTNLDGYTNILSTGNWCFNDTAYNDTIGTNIINKESYYKSNTTFYYDSYVRLVNIKKGASLKCNGTIMNKYKDDNDMLVGALTADEIVFTGGKIGGSNQNNYLINNYQIENSLSFWSITPSAYGGSSDDALYVDSYGKMTTNSVDHYNHSFRPVISITSNTMIIGGTGTIENPYTIQ